jgi:hypothetical protein
MGKNSKRFRNRKLDSIESGEKPRIIDFPELFIVGGSMRECLGKMNESFIHGSKKVIYPNLN